MNEKNQQTLLLVGAFQGQTSEQDLGFRYRNFEGLFR
jgi:hypothetical protein